MKGFNDLHLPISRERKQRMKDLRQRVDREGTLAVRVRLAVEKLDLAVNYCFPFLKLLTHEQLFVMQAH